MMISPLTDNREIIELDSIYLILMGIVQAPQNATGIMAGAIRDAGFTKAPMMVAVIGIWCVCALRASYDLCFQTNNYSHMDGNVHRPNN